MHQIYKSCLLSGVDLIYKRLSISTIKRLNNQKWYQVHLESSFSELYLDIDQAVEQFIKLKGKS